MQKVVFARLLLLVVPKDAMTALHCHWSRSFSMVHSQRRMGNARFAAYMPHNLRDCVTEYFIFMVAKAGGGEQGAAKLYNGL
jgi:hypothetical protein